MRFVARMKRGAKHRLSGFCDYLRHGRRVACHVDMVAAQRHADRPDTPSTIQKAPALSETGCRLLFWVCSELVSYPAEEEVGLPLPPKGSLHFADNVQIQYAGCFFKFAANLSPLPRERVRVRAFSDGANFNFCMAAGLPSPQPSPTGEGLGLPLPSEGGLHLNMTAKCRLPLPRAATLSVGMAAQRHADRSESEIYLIERKCYSGLK